MNGPRHSLLATVLFALTPGLFILVTPYWLTQFNALGSTTVLSLYFLVEAALLYGILLFVARREQSSMLAVFGYNKKISPILFVILAAIGAGYAIYMRDYFSLDALRNFSMSVMQALPGWPSIFKSLPPHDSLFDKMGSSGPVLALIVSLISVGAASAMQTIYFRGFLLSRIDHWGIAAPAFITILFVIFHLGSPWMWPQFLLLTAIWAFIAYFTKNVWVVVVSHVAMNTYSQFLALGAIFSKASGG